MNYETIPPLMFSAYATNPPPASALVDYDYMPFVDMVFRDSNLNLLGVGWLERWGQSYLYPTFSQDLIKYSRAHDTLFLEDNGRVVLGAFGFRIPDSAAPEQTYQVRVGQPSATSDGVGAPGSDVYIDAPTSNDRSGNGTNALKTVTIGQVKYLIGDCAPFRWFNAGEFGNGRLINSDVMQVFQSAVYGWDTPFADSDLFDSMDSCGRTFIDRGNGYLSRTNSSPAPMVRTPSLTETIARSTKSPSAMAPSTCAMCMSPSAGHWTPA